MKISIRGVSMAIVACSSAALAQSHVLKVDAQAGPFTTIQAAVDASDDGDTILVEPGTYASFFIVNKGLSVVGDTGGAVNVNGGVEVRSLAATRAVVLANLVVHGQNSATDWHANGLYLKNDVGAVRMQACTFVGSTTFSFSSAPLCTGVYAETCPDLSFKSCSIQGGLTFAPYVNGFGAGLYAKVASIALYESPVTGHDGLSDCQSGAHLDGGAAGSGSELFGSFMFASGSSFTGGNGGDAPGFPCAPGDGGDGGNGLSLFTTITGSVAWIIESPRSAGFEGLGSCSIGCGNDGTPGVQTSVASGSAFATLSLPKRTINAPAVVREGARWTVSYHGAISDDVGLWFSADPGFQYMSSLAGVKLIEPHHPVIAAPLGVADGAGNLTATLSFPDLGPGVESVRYYCQAIVKTPQGTRFLGSPLCVVVVDSAF